jgi:soluble lytic murein transglycosylase-like protein
MVKTSRPSFAIFSFGGIFRYAASLISSEPPGERSNRPFDYHWSRTNLELNAWSRSSKIVIALRPASQPHGYYSFAEITGAYYNVLVKLVK